MTADRHKNRSDRYQTLFAELAYSHEMIAEFSDASETTEEYKPEDKEKLLDLKEDLVKEFWRLVESELTERQAEVVRLCAQGYTQIEIAKKLGVNQSSITKSLNGNSDYRNLTKNETDLNNKRSYGGSKRKLKRLIAKDEKIKNILAEIAEIHSFYTYY